jgi:alpha-galactosidase
MKPETLIVPRAPFDIEEPWATPRECNPVRLRRAVDGLAPRLTTTVAAFHDGEALTLLFSSADDHVEANDFAHDAPLYEHDVVEAFLAPQGPKRYYEVEVSPRGTVFDARVDSPEGKRATMDVDRSWNCEGLITAVRQIVESNGVMSIDTLLRIPFAGLGRKTPAHGETWLGNFFRIDRHPLRGDEFSAWQPTMKNPPDFHVPAAFGELRFAGR